MTLNEKEKLIKKKDTTSDIQPDLELKAHVALGYVADKHWKDSVDSLDRRLNIFPDRAASLPEDPTTKILLVDTMRGTRCLSAQHTSTPWFPVIFTSQKMFIRMKNWREFLIFRHNKNVT